MKNIININVNNLGYYTLSNVDDGTNSINVQFNKSGICELYYGDQYYEQITIPDSGLVEIPDIYYSDGSNMRFRYKSGSVVSGFFHIIGDASQYRDVTLKKITEAVIQISGVSNTDDEEINSNLLPATRTRLGGVKAGAGLNITKDGTLTVEPIEIEEVKKYVDIQDKQYSVYDKEPDPVIMYYWNTDEFAEENLNKGGTVKDLLEIYNWALNNTANNDRNNKVYIDKLLDELNKTRIGVIDKNKIICTFAESGFDGLENKFEVKGGGYILLDLGCEFYGNIEIKYIESGSYTSKVFGENPRFDGERFKAILFLENGIKTNAVYSINLFQDPDRGCDPLDEIKVYVDVDQRDIQKSINLMYSKVKATDKMVEENVDFLMEEDNKVNARVDDLNSNLSQLEFGENSGGKNKASLNEFTMKYEYTTITNEKLQDGTYTLSVKFPNNPNVGVFAIYNAETKDLIENNIEITGGVFSKTFSVTSECNIALLSNVENYVSDVQIEIGTTATPYEPYIPSVKMLADEVSAQNESLADYGLDNKCSNLVNGYYNADDGSLVTNYNPLRYICSINSYYLKKGETIRVNGNSVDSIYLATYDTNGSFINRKDYYDKKDVTYIAQDNIIIKWSVSFSTDTPISQSPHIGVYINNAIDELKNDLSDNSHLILGFNKDGQYQEAYNCRMYFDGTNLFVQTSSGGNLLVISGATLLA